MRTLENVNRFVIPIQILRRTDMHLQTAGSKGCECFVLWTGLRDNDTFRIRTTHVPRQTAYRYEEGICVRVDGAELHRLNIWLFEHQEELAIQVHSHPTEAYHSQTDNTYPIVTMRGGLSLVVPDFAKQGLRGPGVAYYRLGAAGWQELGAEQVHQLILVEE